MFNKIGFILSVIYLIVLQSVAYAQAPDTLWTRTYGGAIDDKGWDIANAPENGLAVIGFIDTTLILIRTNEYGDTLWTQSYSHPYWDVGMSIEALDNGYLITTGMNVLLRVDSLGNELWHSEFGNAALRSARVTSDGGFIIAGFIGYYHSRIYLAKTDSLGSPIWTRDYAANGAQRAWDIRETPDGGIILLGWIGAALEGYADIYLIKTDENGDSLWCRTYGDGNSYNEGRSILVKEDGGFIIAGKIDNDRAIISTDQSGDIIWTRIYPVGFISVANSVIATSDGAYILVSKSYQYLYYSQLLKLDADGDSLWGLTLPGPGSNIYCRSVAQTPDGGYAVVGNSQIPNNLYDIYLCKLAPEITGIEDIISILPDKITLHQNYPNPFNVNTTISFTLAESQDIVLSIYDLLGRKISVLAHGYFDAGIHNITFDAGDLTSGIYFYILKAGDKRETKSMILLK